MDRKALVYKGMPPNITCCDQRLRILPDGEWVVLFTHDGGLGRWWNWTVRRSLATILEIR